MEESFVVFFLILKCSSIAACLYRKANYDVITSAMLLPARLCVGMYIDQVDRLPLKRTAIFTLDVMYKTSYKTVYHSNTIYFISEIMFLY